jgi:hypothetical protein
VTWSSRCGATDPESQRSVSALDVMEIGPIRERFDETGAAGLSPVDYFASLGAAFMVSELDEVRDAAARLRDQLESSYTEQAAAGAPRAVPRTSCSSPGPISPNVSSGPHGSTRWRWTKRRQGSVTCAAAGGGVPRPGARVGGGPAKGA